VQQAKAMAGFSLKIEVECNGVGEATEALGAWGGFFWKKKKKEIL
jgi:nicotinate-nucleotide pyrophosphorylase